MPVEGLLKPGFEPFAKNYVKMVEDEGRPPAPVARTSPPPAQPAGAGASSAAAAATAAAGGTGRGVAAPVSEVRSCVFVD